MSYSNTARFTNGVDVMFDTNAEMLELLVAEVERWQVYIDPDRLNGQRGRITHSGQVIFPAFVSASESVGR